MLGHGTFKLSNYKSTEMESRAVTVEISINGIEHEVHLSPAERVVIDVDERVDIDNISHTLLGSTLTAEDNNGVYTLVDNGVTTRRMPRRMHGPVILEYTITNPEVAEWLVDEPKRHHRRHIRSPRQHVRSPRRQHNRSPRRRSPGSQNITIQRGNFTKTINRDPAGDGSITVEKRFSWSPTNSPPAVKRARTQRRRAPRGVSVPVYSGYSM